MCCEGREQQSSEHILKDQPAIRFGCGSKSASDGCLCLHQWWRIGQACETLDKSFILSLFHLSI